jgi:hypothetical protein
MKYLQKLRTLKIWSIMLSVLLALSFIPGIPAFAATGITTFTYEGYTVAYNVVNEWEGGQSIEVTLTNTSETPLNNWAIGYDAGAEIQDIYNGSIHSVSGTSYIIKNSGYNTNIAPNSSIAFGYSLAGNGLPIPTAFGLCPTVQTAIPEGYTASLNVTNDWGTGFQGEIILQNTTANEISGWQLSFNTNFNISNIWNGEIFSQTENSYIVTGNTIPANGSVTIGFGGEKAVEIVPTAENFALSASSLSDTIIPGVLISQIPDNTGTNNQSDFYSDTIIASLQGDDFPLSLFASESGISITSDDISINGDLGSNGEINLTSTKRNINGLFYKSNIDMIQIGGKINTNYFSDSKIIENDYFVSQPSISIVNSTKVQGQTSLIGNINLASSVQAYGTININGDVNNGNNVVMYSKYGDVNISTTTLTINGLIYAPNGDVTINAENINVNGAIIAQNIYLKSSRININKNETVQKFIGTKPYPAICLPSEWPYMQDSDGDGLPDMVEDSVNLDKNNIDTDNDGLNDYYESMVVGSSGSLFDTLSAGISDGLQDYDEDGFTNLDEYQNGTHPLIYNENNSVGQSTNSELYINEDKTDPITAVLVELDSNESTLNEITITNLEDNNCLSNDVIGLYGSPYQIESKLPITKAKIEFLLSDDTIHVSDYMVVWYDEENQNYVPLETEYTENSVFAVVTHFSKYMVVNKNTWNDFWKNNFLDIYDLEGYSYDSAVDTIIAIDCSGSMSNIDSNSSYRTAAIDEYVKTMRPDDRVGVVSFDSDAGIMSDLINKEDAKQFTFYSSGGTDFSSPINLSLDMLANTRIDSVKYIILVSDGSASYPTEAISNAKEKGIKIITVGLGAYSSDDVLKRISTATEGEFHKVSNISSFSGLFANLGYLNIFDQTDTDKDGLSDVFEIAGMYLANSKKIITDPYNNDTDGDSLLDGEEISFSEIKRIDYSVDANILEENSYYKFTVKSYPDNADSNNNGTDDSHDPEPLNNQVIQQAYQPPQMIYNTIRASGLSNYKKASLNLKNTTDEYAYRYYSSTETKSKFYDRYSYYWYDSEYIIDYMTKDDFKNSIGLGDHVFSEVMNLRDMLLEVFTDLDASGTPLDGIKVALDFVIMANEATVFIEFNQTSTAEYYNIIKNNPNLVYYLSVESGKISELNENSLIPICLILNIWEFEYSNGSTTTKEIDSYYSF